MRTELNYFDCADPTREADSRLITKEIPLLNPKSSLICSQELATDLPIFSLMNPIHTHTPHFLIIRFNIILLATIRSLRPYQFFEISDQNFVRISQPIRLLHVPPIPLLHYHHHHCCCCCCRRRRRLCSSKVIFPNPPQTSSFA
jgi:hypothetical protein